MWAFFTTVQGDFLLNEHSRGAAGRNRPLNINSLLKEKIPIPDITEQEKIADFVIKEQELKKTVEVFECLLKERRQALVNLAIMDG